MNRKSLSLLSLTCLALLSACGKSAESPAGKGGDILLDAASLPQNWPTYGGTYAEQRYSTLDQINDGNVGDLKLAWFQDFDTARGQEATPLVVDGVLYTSTAWSKVYAYEAATGKQLWMYDPQVPGKTGVDACCDVVNRGVAFHDGRVFVGTLDGRLIAIDAKTGKPVWTTQTTDPSKPYTISGAPRVARGKVFIGNGGADLGVRGYVSAYDEKTGKLAWRFYTVPGAPGKKDGAASDEILAKLASSTWFGDQYLKLGGGGTVWDTIVYDQELNRLYIGVGNGSPLTLKDRSEGKGDNLFLSSIVALDPDTGKYLWHYQEVPGETWDFTATAQITLATLNIGGARRQVLMHAPKNGFFYVIDRKDGKLISAEKFAPVNWAERVDLKTGRPVEAKGARYENGPFMATSAGAGAHSWQPMSYSPKTGLVYIPTQQLGAIYNLEKGFRITPGQWNLGYDMMTSKMPTDPAVHKQIKASLKGWLSAWDPVTQKEKWRVPHDGPWNGGTLATAGNLVFQGTARGTFEAYRASDGRKLWSFAAQSGVMGGPTSFSVDGQQYIAVLAGYGGAVPLSLPSFDGPTTPINGRVLVFRLGGKAALPALAATALPPITAPTFAISADRAEKGRILFGNHCAACHGLDAWSGGVVPDLRRSGAMGDEKVWHDIVIGGALESRGMVSFAKMLSPEQAESIRQYVGGQAKVLAAQKAPDR